MMMMMMMNWLNTSNCWGWRGDCPAHSFLVFFWPCRWCFEWTDSGGASVSTLNTVGAVKGPARPHGRHQTGDPQHLQLIGGSGISIAVWHSFSIAIWHFQKLPKMGFRQLSSKKEALVLWAYKPTLLFFHCHPLAKKAGVHSVDGFFFLHQLRW